MLLGFNVIYSKFRGHNIKRSTASTNIWHIRSRGFYSIWFLHCHGYNSPRKIKLGSFSSSYGFLNMVLKTMLKYDKATI